MVEIGETVGIIAAQSIGEPGTQLTMRTFHTGGIFSGEEENNIISPVNGTLIYDNKGGKKILTKYYEKAFLTYQEKKVIIHTNKFKNYRIKLPKYSIIYNRPYQKVYSKQTIAKMIDYKNKFTKKIREKKEIKTSVTGQIMSKDVKDISKKNIKQIWILNGNIISYSKLTYNIKNIKILETNIKKITIKNKLKLNINNFQYHTKNNRKTQGINYIIQRKITAEKELLVKKHKTEKKLYIPQNKKSIGNLIYKHKKLSKNIINKKTNLVLQKYKNILNVKKTNPYIVPKKSKILNKNSDIIKKNNNIAYINYKKQKNEDIVQGLPKVEELLEAKKTINLQKINNNPHDKLVYIFTKIKYKFNNETAVRKAIEKLQDYLIEKIQNVYNTQNVNISRKHIEIIVKQMTSKVLITETDSKDVLIGEIIEINQIERINANKTIKIKYEPIILGISKVNLTNQSFIAQACFQETVRTLTKSAIQGKIDWLYGLKENLILGNIIPAGTGFKNK